MLISMLNDVDRFLNDSTYSAATKASYAYTLKRFAEWLDRCGLQPEDVTPYVLRQFLSDHKWSDNMKRLYGNAIKSFFRWRYGETHPALPTLLPRDNASPGRSLEQDEVDRLLASFDTMTPLGWRDLSIVALMLETGLRASEVCRLDLRHLDVRRGKLQVLVKGNKWRETTFSEDTAHYLDVWLTVREEIAYPDVTTVFVGIKGKTPGKPMTASGLRANFRRYGENFDIGRLSPHDLRRTMATLLTENGAPTRLVQQLGGWNDIRMVERYTRRLKPKDIERWSPISRKRITRR